MWDLVTDCASGGGPATCVPGSKMQLTFYATRRTPHGASCLVHAISAWSVKTRRAPSWHCRDARVNSLETTAVHENEYTPTPPSLLLSLGCRRCSFARCRRFFLTRKDALHPPHFFVVANQEVWHTLPGPTNVFQVRFSPPLLSLVSQPSYGSYTHTSYMIYHHLCTSIRICTVRYPI